MGHGLGPAIRRSTKVPPGGYALGVYARTDARRLFIFLERSIYEGTQWVVFEPNYERLWARVKDAIRVFLRSQWRDGALFGARKTKPLHQLRSHDDESGRRPERPSDLRDRHRTGATRGLRDLPHLPADRRSAG